MSAGQLFPNCTKVGDPPPSAPLPPPDDGGSPDIPPSDHSGIIIDGLVGPLKSILANVLDGGDAGGLLDGVVGGGCHGALPSLLDGSLGSVSLTTGAEGEAGVGGIAVDIGPAVAGADGVGGNADALIDVQVGLKPLLGDGTLASLLGSAPCDGGSPLTAAMDAGGGCVDAGSVAAGGTVSHGVDLSLPAALIGAEQGVGGLGLDLIDISGDASAEQTALVTVDLGHDHA